MVIYVTGDVPITMTMWPHSQGVAYMFLGALNTGPLSMGYLNLYRERIVLQFCTSYIHGLLPSSVPDENTRVCNGIGLVHFKVSDINIFRCL